MLTSKASWKSLYNIGITKGITDIVKQHHRQLLSGTDAIQVPQTSCGRFLAKLINILSILKCLFSSSHQVVVNDGVSPDDRDYNELVASHNNDGFPLDQSSCEPVDMKAFAKAQLIQQIDECYTR